jgi:hypothetical protein
MVTMTEIDHPLVPTDTSSIRIVNRPRFTLSEAVLLNMLVNAQPDMVSMERLRARVGLVSSWGTATNQTIQSLVGSLRAKLGEPAHHPRQIRGVKAKRLNTWGAETMQLVGYRWADPNEPLDDV